MTETTLKVPHTSGLLEVFSGDENTILKLVHHLPYFLSLWQEWRKLFLPSNSFRLVFGLASHSSCSTVYLERSREGKQWTVFSFRSVLSFRTFGVSWISWIYTAPDLLDELFAAVWGSKSPATVPCTCLAMLWPGEQWFGKLSPSWSEMYPYPV